MRIGVAREIKPQEGRVALLPEQVQALVAAGHSVRVEQDAGKLSGAGDDDYRAAGAAISPSPEALWGEAELIVKVKEILPPEYPLLERRHAVFTNLHTALNRELTDTLLEVGLTGLSAEEMHRYGTPNSPLAGEVGALEGLRLCFAPFGGTGRHFVGHYGSQPVAAVVVGLGGAGLAAARVLCRLGCRVVGLDQDAGARYRAGLALAHEGLATDAIDALPYLLGELDLLVNCVRWDKTRRDHLISRADLAKLKPTAVVCDISCDEAGAIETSRPTSWDAPTYREEGIRHFAVDNVPGAVPVAASAGYGRALLPFLLEIGEHGVLEACRRDSWLARGLTCLNGELILEETGRYQNRPFVPLADVLSRFGAGLSS
jgi:alanine dehydrogenase